MAEYLIQEETLNQIAEAIRAKTESDESISVTDMAIKIGEIDGIWEKMQKGTLTEWVDDEIIELKSGNFYNYKILTSLNCPKLKNISTSYCFSNCDNLKEVNLPSLEEINGQDVFAYSGVENIYLPSLKKFSNTNVGQRTFVSCKSLISIDCPQLTVASWGMLYDSTATNINLPQLQTIGGYFCYGNTKLTTITLPSLTKIPRSSDFFGCTALTYADFPVLTTLSGSNTFQNCSSLTALVLRKSDTIVTLSNISSFTNSGIANGIGYIYVPAALIEEYKSATNWSTYATQFRALEDYTVDGTITGELDETKIAEAAE